MAGLIERSDSFHTSRSQGPAAGAPLGVTGAQLRRCMGEFATGVTVVTTMDSGGRPVGVTANAVTSLSLDPPLITVFFANTSQTLASVLARGEFAVNILAAAQGEVSKAFAVSGAAAAWGTCDLRPDPDGLPLIAGCLSWLKCSVSAVLPGGDHKIIVGLVGRAEYSGAQEPPLIFARGGYRTYSGDSG
jgi:flavin reductase (DIM6/NTAB) family NADH-FMN oxidoreductase RutF